MATVHRVLHVAHWPLRCTILGVFLVIGLIDVLRSFTAKPQLWESKRQQVMVAKCTVRRWTKQAGWFSVGSTNTLLFKRAGVRKKGTFQSCMAFGGYLALDVVLR